DAAAGDHARFDGMIESANTARLGADAQIGAEGQRQKAARQFGGREAGVFGGRAGERTGRRRLSAGSGDRRCQQEQKKHQSKKWQISSLHPQLPSPLWGGVGGGGRSRPWKSPIRIAATPTPALRADPPHKGEGKKKRGALRHDMPSYSRRCRTRPSWATDATSVPSRVNISPREKPREPCRLGESCA